MHEFNETFIQILILLAVAIAVTSVAKLLKQPYSIALVIVGLILGVVHFPGLDHVKEFITQSVVFQVIIISIFLPALLGEATLKLPFSHLKENKKPISALAFAGTFMSFLLISFSGYYILELPLVVAFVFGALMSATDPISVLSIFKTAGVNKKLTTIIEGESLFNDGIAVVLFQISAFYLLTYIEMGWLGLGYGVLLFLKFVLGGLAIGGIMGFVFSQLTRFFDDYPLEIVFSVILFFGSFLIAEHFHVSGVIAVVISGLTFGNYGSKIGMSPVTRLNINNFWDVIALIANSMIFLMVGLEITHINFGDKWGLIALSILIVIIARSIAVYTSLSLIKNFPWKSKHLLNWGGLKGSLSIALALSLPHTFAGREDVLVLTFSVVLFSLIVQGLTIKPLISKLKILDQKKGVLEYEETISHIHRLKKALTKLEEMREQSLVSKHVYEQLHQEYTGQKELYYEKLDQLYHDFPEIKKEQLESAKREKLYVEYQAVSELGKRDIISNIVESQHKRELLEKIETIEDTRGK
jgi:CPA1 family monovalent cation:H+ antiporter